MQHCFLTRIHRAILWGAASLCALALGACGTLQAPPRATVYDFGPGATAPLAANRMAPLPPLVLADVEASAALDGTAVLYRLMYADAQQLRPYAQARWSMPPAQLLRQRLREQLGARRQVLAPGDAQPAGDAHPALQLRVELEEFTQLFDAPQSSSALVRVRATLGRVGARTLAQQSFVLQRPSVSADAAGGVKALAETTDALIAQIDTWLQQSAAALPATAQ